MHQDKKCTIIKNAIVQPTRALGIAALTHHRLQHQANLFYEDIKLNDIVIMTISANDAPFSVDLLRGREQIEMLLFLYKKEAKKAHQCKRGMDTFSLRFLLATEIRFVHKTKENPYLSDGMFQCLVILQFITQFLNQSNKSWITKFHYDFTIEVESKQTNFELIFINFWNYFSSFESIEL